MSNTDTSTACADKQTNPDPFALTEADRKVLQDRCISIRIAEAAGLRHYPGKERAESKRWCKERSIYVDDDGLPHIPVEGITIPHGRNDDGTHRYRVRLAETSYEKPVADDHEMRGETETVECPRYWIPPGTTVGPYILKMARHAAKSGNTLYLVEAPLKALALMSNGYPAIGLGGVLAGAHDSAALKELGEIMAHADLAEMPWHPDAAKRVVVSIFDAGQTSNPQVALGVAYAWQAFSSIGVTMRVGTLPENSDPKNRTGKARDQGPDDFLARSGRKPLADVTLDETRDDVVDGLRKIGETWQLLGRLRQLSGDNSEQTTRLVEDAANVMLLSEWWKNQDLKTLDPELTQQLKRRRREMSAAPALDPIIRASYPADPVRRVKALVAQCKNATERTEVLRPLLRDLVFVACLRVGGKLLQGDVVAASERGLKVADLKAAVAGFGQAMAKKMEKSRNPAASPYTYQDGVGFCVEGKDGPVRLSNFYAEITEEKLLRGYEGDRLMFTIEGKLADGTQLDSIEVPADEYDRMEWVTAKWGSTPIIEPRGMFAVRNAIKGVSSAKREVSYTQAGWHCIDDRRVYLMPGGAIGERGHAVVPCRPPSLDGYQRPDMPESDADAIEAFRHSLGMLDLGPHRVTAPLLAMTYLAPIASIIGGVPMVLWVVGQSGGFKSSLAALAQSHFGHFDFDALPLSFHATANMIEKRIHTSRDLLVTVDNLVPSKTGRSQLEAIDKAQRLCQMIGDGQSRGRLNREAEERAALKPQTAVIVTAELLPPDNDSTLGRTFQVHISNGEVDRLKIQEARLKLDLYGQSMARYIQWLASLDHKGVRQMREEARLWVSKNMSLEGHHPRALDQLAMMHMAVFLLRRYAYVIGADVEQELDNCWSGIVAALARQARPEHLRGWESWLDAVHTMLTQGKVALASSTGCTLEPDHREIGEPPAPEKIGWRSGSEVLLHPTATHRAVERYLGANYRFDSTEIHRDLRTAMWALDDGTEIPVLLGTDGRHVCPKRTAGGQKQRVLVLDARVFAGAAHSNDDDDYEGVLDGV